MFGSFWACLAFAGIVLLIVKTVQYFSRDLREQPDQHEDDN